MKIYLVGGAVRDIALDRIPHDYDYCVVGASVQEMLDAGYKQVGADFPVFLHPQTNDEYALARVERKTGAGYGGFATETNGVTLEEDLSRRDLTINAMAMPVDMSKVIDPFGGLQDLKDGILRHVSPAFSEDPLRVLRVGRFLARYQDFTVAPETMVLCRKLVSDGALNELSIERYWAELVKVFGETFPERFFDFIVEIGADVHVKFFHELYGTIAAPKLAKIKKIAQTVAKEMYGQKFGATVVMMIHTALTAMPEAPTLKTATSDLKALTEHVDDWRSTSTLATPIFELLTRTKAFSKEHPAFINLTLAVYVAEEAGYGQAVRYSTLWSAQSVGSMLTASNFPDVKGKALGEAIAQARKKAIAEIL